jgi:hypothetical protein
VEEEAIGEGVKKGWIELVQRGDRLGIADRAYWRLFSRVEGLIRALNGMTSRVMSLYEQLYIAISGASTAKSLVECDNDSFR